MTYLVTGAYGALGAWVVRALLDREQEVVTYDLGGSDHRLRLSLTADELEALRRIDGDVTDLAALERVIDEHDVTNVIHLAALQVPFCKADPVAGAKVNVVGTVNVLETARHLGLKRLAYASSIAVQGMGEDSPWLATLYGAHKACGEAMAAVYWQDWQVPSIGIRPWVLIRDED